MRTGIPMGNRYDRIMEVLGKAEAPLSARLICERYIIGEITASDPLSTGTILNVLAKAGIVKKHIEKSGKSNKVTYELA